jgi:hypothetical protein
MLSKEQFRERAKRELRQIGDQVLSLATDREIYERLERDVIAANPQLRDSCSPLFDRLRGNHVDAMIARVLCLVTAEASDVSLPRTLSQLADYPELLHDKVTQREFADDRSELAKAASGLKQVSGPRFAHHERTLSALAPAHRELNRAIDLLISTVKTYYWVVGDSHIDLEVKYFAESMEIFSFAWAVPLLKT